MVNSRRKGCYRQIGSNSSGRGHRLAPHVFAAAEQQCRLVGVGVTLDVADEDNVVAAVMAIFVAAFEMRGGADQHRRAAFRDDVIDLGELVVVRPGEFVR
jgi:hypothetical protein